MKIKIITVFLTLTALAACTSTSENTQESAASVNSGSKANVAKVPNFNSEGLKWATEKLGYKCSYEAVTGSRLKQKVCSTKQERDELAEAAKRYMRESSTSSIAAPRGT